MNSEDSIVIVGGGHAAAQLCASLAAAGVGGRIDLVCEEAVLPSQRPPLSKSYVKNPDETPQLHRGEAWYAQQGIRVHQGDAATAIDRAGRSVTLRSGAHLRYRWLVLATGTRARHLPHLSPSLDNVHVLRDAADAQRLRALWPAMQQLTVLGGGFIGLELAATAQALGKKVQVLEAAPRLLMRSASAELSNHVLQTHRNSGMDIRLGVSVGDFEVASNRLSALTVDGVRTPVDSLLLGIGAAPETSLAEQAGLDCGNGVVVDAGMRTSDPAILAIGDCALFPGVMGSGAIRLESVQNANDQAKVAAATIMGEPHHYEAVPWFWTEQASLRIQMAGLLPKNASCYRRPGKDETSFSLLHYAQGQLRCVESVNAPADHMAARKLLELKLSPAPEQACNPQVALRTMVTPAA
ncbi:MAG: ferredoxin reductase [Burkholderiales bacterium 66-5]|nr:MAG: ferredoxin reductase [Burkholderiales bacterium 66-5]